MLHVSNESSCLRYCVFSEWGRINLYYTAHQFHFNYVSNLLLYMGPLGNNENIFSVFSSSPSSFRKCSSWFSSLEKNLQFQEKYCRVPWWSTVLPSCYANSPVLQGWSDYRSRGKKNLTNLPHWTTPFQKWCKLCPQCWISLLPKRPWRKPWIITATTKPSPA